jgi:glucoamylase
MRRLSWRFSDKIRFLSKGKSLRIEVLAPACVRWSADGWKTLRDLGTRDSKLGIHFVDLPAAQFATGTELVFTFHWTNSGNWEGKNFTISL